MQGSAMGRKGLRLFGALAAAWACQGCLVVDEPDPWAIARAFEALAAGIRRAADRAQIGQCEAPGLEHLRARIEELRHREEAALTVWAAARMMLYPTCEGRGASDTSDAAAVGVVLRGDSDPAPPVRFDEDGCPIDDPRDVACPLEAPR